MPQRMAAAGSSGRGWHPGRGIMKDLTGRLLPHYRSDWVQGLTWGTRILPPAAYIFFASVLPALAFGQQLATDTEGTLNVVHVLVSTALSGLAQSIIGGQPLLIIGVAEPIVIIYGFMYSFAKHSPGLGVGLFLPWAAWVCIWTAVLCCLLAVLGAAEGISYFTRFSGELFGALIAILFLQVGIKGIVHEFEPSPLTSPGEPWQLTLINGLWSLLLSLALLLSSIQILKARSWRLGRSWLRGFLADYGVPLMVVLWSGVSFAVSPAPHVPRRVSTPNTWEVRDTWTVAGHLGDVPGSFIAAALLPALIITVLFYFDHNVSSQMAQQPEFNLVKGSAYHWDFLLLSALTLVCGLLGLPPVNGVLPQAPMHTRSLAHIRKPPDTPPAGHTAAEAAAADGGTTLHSSSNSEADWLQDSQEYAAAGKGPGGTEPSSVTAVTESFSHLHLGGHTSSTAAHAEHAGAQQRPEGIAAMTTALSHMHLNTPAECRLHDSPFGTPTATAARCQAKTPFHTSVQATSAAAGGCSHAESALRHRQRSLSPTHTMAGSAGATAAPQQQHHQQQQASLEMQQQQQQQQRRGRAHGRLHPSGSDVAINTMPDSAVDGIDDPVAGSGKEPEPEHPGVYLKLEVREQRVSNLLQSLLVAACLGITPAIQQIPTGVLWGYFIFMAVESLQGSQLWERLLLIATDPKKRVMVLQQEHAAYLQLVPFHVVVRFTLLQLVYLLGVWALTTWAGIAGIAFPLPIMALVPLRQFVLPRLFERAHLTQLDAAEYEEAPPVPDKLRAAQELFELGAIAEAPAPELPVTTTGGPGCSGVGLWGEEEDEAEVVSKEFHGLQIKHHLTRESLEQQQQQLRRRTQP